MATTPSNASNTPLIAALYARGLIDYLRASNVEPTRIFPAEQVARFDNARGHAELSLAEWVGMLETSVEKLGKPCLPAAAGSSLQIRHLGILGHVLMGCDTLADVYQQLARYIRLIGQIGQPELITEGERAELLWQWPFNSTPPGCVAQFMLAARVTFMRWLSNRPDLKFDAWFHFPDPDSGQELERIFGGTIHYNCPANKLTFDAAFLDLPVVSGDDAFEREIQARAQALLHSLSHEAPEIRDLKLVLTHNLASGNLSLRATAKRLNVSERTLQRQLSKQGTSFQRVLDAVRQEQAEKLLAAPDVSLKQIAFLLGYTEQSTFQNAFRRWTDLSPGAFRKRAANRRDDAALH